MVELSNNEIKEVVRENYAKVAQGASSCCDADSSCCGSNDLKTRDDYPVLHWALKQSGDFVRVWWDQETYQEVLLYRFLDQPIVSGSLRQDPFGDGVVALTSVGISLVSQREKTNGSSS